MRWILGFVRPRAGVLAVLSALALLERAVAPPPPPPTPPGLAQALGARVGGRVDPADIVWEPSRGLLADALLGRRVLFLAAAGADARRDLFRARVRVGRDGAPARVLAPRNLSQTPLGDEAGLAARSGHAAFASVAYGAVQAVTVLDLEGAAPPEADASPLAVLPRALTAWQQTGTLRGLGRTDILFDVPPAAVDVELAPPRLVIAADGRSRALVYDLDAGTLAQAGGGPVTGARLSRPRPAAKPVVLWAVDTVRAEVGPGPVAWAEGVAFTAADLGRRVAFLLRGGAGGARVAAPAAAAPRRVAAAPGDEWPPPNLPSMWQEELPGEGVWEPVEYPFLARVAGAKEGAPPYFFRTFVRPDPERPYSRLLLVALDMRQLDLRVQAGHEDPKPLPGPPGTGRIPRDPGVLDRVVATFNGAFKTDHGTYGMVVDRRGLLPPVAGAATFLVDDRGRVGFGTWSGPPALPADVVSLRQNLEPLLVDGIVNPTGRKTWGEQLGGTSVQTQRTALCVTAAGHVLYGFGASIDAESLGRGLRQAGCTYALHLDMNPGHCGFVFADVLDMDQHRFELRKADPAMKIAPDKFIFASAKDFFYVLVRDLAPPPLPSGTWRACPGRQPDPDFLPAIFSARLPVGGVNVELTSFADERFDFALRAGEREPRPLDAPPPVLELAAADQARAVAAVGLGATTPEQRLGLSFHHLPTLPLRDEAATLVVSPEGTLRISPPSPNLRLAAGEAAVQLPLLAVGSALEPRAAAPGPMRERAALGVTDDGRVVVARATHDTGAVLASALVLAGCKLVVELERGAQLPPFVQQAGTETPPRPREDATVLLALDRTMRPRAYRWAAPSPPPITTTPGSEPRAAAPGVHGH